MRRTPKLTAKARIMFEDAIRNEGWQPGGTIPTIARAIGLTDEQVRDSIFAETADEWRAGLTDRIGRASQH